MPKLRKYNPEKRTIFHVSVSSIICNRVDEMSEYWGISGSEVIRMAITELYPSMLKEKFGYQAGEETSKNNLRRVKRSVKREDTIHFIQQLEEDKLIDYLIERGLIDPIKEISPGIWSGFKMIDGVLCNISSGKPDLSEIHYKSTWLNSKEEIIDELIKQKLI